MLQRLDESLTEAQREFIGPVGRDELKSAICKTDTAHEVRASIGIRLALIGDDRPGVGVKNGLPDIDWCPVPAGRVDLEGGAGSFDVEACLISKYTITVAQWRTFLNACDGYDVLIRKTRGWAPAQQRGRDNQPAVDLTWVEAMAFCQWLSAGGNEVRLPTEWEWQQAATGGNPGNQYPWGADWAENRANTLESNLGRMVAVGLYPSGVSAQGVSDLVGNVWEWCLNQFDHPKEIGTNSDAPRVVRGGSWNNNQGIAHCVHRNHYGPDFRDCYRFGFRVVCVCAGS